MASEGVSGRSLLFLTVFPCRVTWPLHSKLVGPVAVRLVWSGSALKELKAAKHPSNAWTTQTGLTTVWPSASAAANTPVQALHYAGMPRLSVGCCVSQPLLFFWAAEWSERCSLGLRCHTSRHSCTKMSLKMAFKDLAASKGSSGDSPPPPPFKNPCDFLS